MVWTVHDGLHAGRSQCAKIAFLGIDGVSVERQCDSMKKVFGKSV